MSPLEYHVLLALAAHALHGYAIRDAVAADSGGAVDPRAGSLYRVIARLVAGGLVREAEPGEERGPHPGLERRYYALTAAGRRALGAEAGRAKRAAGLAQRRLGSAQGRS